MNFDTEKKTIDNLLSSKKQYKIPRFQREYSWEKIQLTEFFDDIVNQIKIDTKGELATNEYFWGTMLFVGNFTDSRNLIMEVVDGQQRLTTITIFLSVLASIFQDLNEAGLSDKVRESVLFTDNNLNKIATLLNETPNPYFQRLVQKIDNRVELNPKTEEEQKLEYAYNFIGSKMEEQNLRKIFNSRGINVTNKKYLDLLKVIWEQLTSSVLICISTKEKEEASMIFEILNAKGKSLNDIDLIKNKIFETLKNETPVDDAKDLWKRSRENLVSRNEYIDFSTFYRHFWLSKYGVTQKRLLLQAFKKHISNTENDYMEFLINLEKASKTYLTITVPQLSDFSNKVEYKYFIEIVNNLNNSFNIVQTRIFILSLYEAHFDRKTVSASSMKKVLQYIEKFHFVFNSLMASKTSSLETIYSKYAIKLRQSTNKQNSNIVINELINQLSDKIPPYTLFQEKFIALEYSKDNNSSNLKTKYAIHSIAKHLNNQDVIANDASIEHIKNEDKTDNPSLTIGNLLIVEQNINSTIQPTASFTDKLSLYKGSAYLSTRKFIQKYSSLTDWTNESIKKRADELAELYYTKILDGKINKF